MGCSANGSCSGGREVVPVWWKGGVVTISAVTLQAMTSTTNARELERLRQARTLAQERFARQMKLLEQITATAAEREAITKRWHGQLAALAELSGGPASAAELSGLPKADIDAAVKSVDPAEVASVIAAAQPAPRRRRRAAEASNGGRAAATGTTPPAAGGGSSG